ncbi:MAG: hypothetical protein E7127_02740 [Rikenellaceae bacterium]|nr:hypothetical protein [Rikenellaceae bacterium]
MKKLLNFSLAIIAVAFVACSYEDVALSTNESPSNPYEVTPDEAVQLLQTVMGGESTRAISVGSIQTLRKSDFVPTTRGAEDGDVVYIVDLEDGGSAIMGADKRMEPIYAILDETKISPEQLTLSATRSDDGEQDIEEYVMGLVNNKIQVDVMGFEHTLPEMPMIPRDQTWTETTVIGRQSPLLRTKWGQDHPFNLRFPLIDNCVFNREFAGCVTVAVAQIMCYNRFPNLVGNRAISWNLASQYDFENTSPSDDVINAVAWLMWAVALELPADWGGTDTRDDGTASSIEDAAALMTRHGYYSVQIINELNTTVVIDMLCDREQPVYIRGRSEVDGESAYHAWLIDGCNVYKEDFWVRHYIDSFRFNEYIENTKEYNLLHCNFGYEGRCDGYYSSGLFKLYPAPSLDDEYIDSSVGDLPGSKYENYASDFKIMVYDL